MSLSLPHEDLLEAAGKLAEWHDMTAEGEKCNADELRADDNEDAAKVGDEFWAFHIKARTTLIALVTENRRLREALEPFALVASEYDRWQAKGSTTKAAQLGFTYGKAQFGMKEFRRARAALTTQDEIGNQPSSPSTSLSGQAARVDASTGRPR